MGELPSRPALPWPARLRQTLWAVVLAVPLALLAAAAASLVLALVALPVALLVTRDGYVALLALSYGPFAASVALQAIIGATLAWAIARPTLGEPRGRVGQALTAGTGMVAGVVGLVAGSVPLFTALPVPWRYGPALPVTLVSALVAALLGLVAGGIAHAGTARVSAAPLDAGWRGDLRRATWHLVGFALPLSLLFEGWVALLSALGRI